MGLPPISISLENFHLRLSRFSVHYSNNITLRPSLAMGDSCSTSYIRMVQHLIEKCLLFHMTQEECAEALSKHADIEPIVTNTVWKELEKENKGFFEAYSKGREEGLSSAEKKKKIQQMIFDASSKP